MGPEFKEDVVRALNHLRDEILIELGASPNIKYKFDDFSRCLLSWMQRVDKEIDELKKLSK